MTKNMGRKGYLKRLTMTLSAVILSLFIPITALADGEFAGDIIISNALAGYEYRVYEVLECIGAGGDDSVFMATESWKEFLKANENAVAMLVPKENDGNYPMADEGSDLYTVNLESSKEVRQAFAADVLEYAKENGIDAYESITAEEREVTFEYVPLGIYVIDTADKARITVMWDMGWESEIKESYKPEAETADTSTEAVEKTETKQESVNNTEENSDMTTDTSNAEAASEEKTEEKLLTAGEETPKADSIVPVIIVIAAVVLAVSAILFFVRKKK